MTTLDLANYDNFRDVMGRVVDSMNEVSDNGFPEEKVLADQVAHFKKTMEAAEGVLTEYETADGEIKELNALDLKQKAYVKLNEQLAQREYGLLDELRALKSDLEQKLKQQTDSEASESDEIQKLRADIDGKKETLDKTQKALKKNGEEMTKNAGDIDAQKALISTRQQYLVQKGMWDAEDDLLDESAQDKLAKTVNNVYGELLRQKGEYGNKWKELKQTTESLKESRQKLKQECLKAKNLMSVDNPTDEQKGALYKSLTTMTSLTPGYHGDTLSQLETNTRAALYEVEATKLKEQLRKKFQTPLKKAGSSQKVTFEFEGGVGFGILAAKAGVTFKLGLSYDVNVGSDGKINVVTGHEESLNVTAKVGGGLPKNENQAKGKIKGALSFSTAKNYASVEDFVEAEASQLGTAFLEYTQSVNPIPYKALKNRNTAQKADSFREKAVTGQDELQRRLRRMNVIQADQSLSVPVRTEVSFTTTDTSGKSAALDLAATLKVAGDRVGIEGAAGVGKEKLQEIKSRKVPLVDELLAHPALQEMNALGKKKYYGFAMPDDTDTLKTYSGDEAVNRLHELEDSISTLTKAEATKENIIKLAAQRRKLKSGLEDLYLEYQAFVYTENRVAANPSEHNGDIGKARNQMRLKRGAGDSVEYLKAVTVQYAHLRRLYENSFRDDEQPDDADSEFLEEFSQEIKYPRFKTSDKAMKKHLNVTEATSPKNKSRVTGSLSVKMVGLIAKKPTVQTTTELKVGLKKETVTENNAVAEETCTLTFSTPVDTLLKTDDVIINAMGRPLVEKWFGKSDSKTIQMELKEVLRDVAMGSMEVTLVKRHGKWGLKYVRGFDDRTKKLGVKGTIVTGTGVDVKLGTAVSSTQKQTRFEYLGGNTLTHFADVFARNAKDGANDPKWKKFKQENNVFKRLFKNLKNAESTASKEMDDWLTELGESGESADKETAEKMKTALKNFRQSETDTGEDLLKAFEDVMVKRKAIVKKKKEAGFKARREIQKQPMKEYAAQLITRNMKAYMKKRNMSDTDVTDMDTFLDKARKRYQTSQKTQSDFKNLEQAYAIDYAAQHLEDLIGSKKSEKNNQALDIIEGDDIRGEAEDPKIYVGKKAYGKMRQLSDGKLDVRTVVEAEKNDGFNRTEAKTNLKGKMGALTFTSPDTIYREDSGGFVEQWTPPMLSKRKTVKNVLSRKMKSTRSLASRRPNSIGQYIAKMLGRSSFGMGSQRGLGARHSSKTAVN